MFKRNPDFSEFKKIPKTNDILGHCINGSLVVLVGMLTYSVLNGFPWIVGHVVPFAILRGVVVVVGSIAGLYYAGLAFQTLSRWFSGSPDPVAPAAATVMPGSTENSSNDQV